MPEDKSQGSRHILVLQHAQIIAELLAGEWLTLDDGTTGNVRAWYAYYENVVPELTAIGPGYMLAFAVVQNRHYGTVLCRIMAGAHETIKLEPGVSLVSACVWLGLEDIPLVLHWHYDV